MNESEKAVIHSMLAVHSEKWTDDINSHDLQNRYFENTYTMETDFTHQCSTFLLAKIADITFLPSCNNTELH